MSNMELNEGIVEITHSFISYKPEICLYSLFYKALADPDLTILIQL